jgi:hypothetical protein
VKINYGGIEERHKIGKSVIAGCITPGAVSIKVKRSLHRPKAQAGVEV